MTKRSAEKGLPAHWRRGRLLAAMVAMGVVALVTFLLREVGRADRLDGWWLSARFTFRERMAGAPRVDPDIVMVDIDDKSSQKWKEPLAFWGPHFGAALKKMTADGVKLVAFDYIPATSPSYLATQQNVPQFESFLENFDAKFGEGLQQSPDVVMVKELRPAQNGKPPEWLRPPDELLYNFPQMAKNPDWDADTALGYPEVEKQAVVSSFRPVKHDDKKLEIPFAVRVVEHFLGGRATIDANQFSIPGKVQIPLRENGTFLINYANFTQLRDREGHRVEPIEIYSLCDVADGTVNPGSFRGKIALIGSSWTGLNDLHYIPFFHSQGGGNRLVAGTQIQANIVRTLLDNRPIQEPSLNGIWLLSSLLGLVGLVAFSRFRWVAAACICIAAALAWIGASFWLFNAHDFALPINLPLAGVLLAGVILGGYRALGEERERRQVMGLWGRYQNPVVVDYLLQHPEARGGEGSEQMVTVLFADLKNFTKTVEMLEPRDALRMLNRYLGLMEEVISKYGGCVDKYLGDGLMAEWGVPSEENKERPGEHHAVSAVLACIELDRRTRELTASIAGDRAVTFGLRLTLHSGPVVVGWVGANRLEFTIIGDTVNVTSRLQETAKQMNVEFLISESTYHFVDKLVVTGKEEEVEIRGRQQPLHVYEVTAQQATEPAAAVA